MSGWSHGWGLQPSTALFLPKGTPKEPLSVRHHLKITLWDDVYEPSQAVILSLERPSKFGAQIYTCYHGNLLYISCP